MKSAALWLRAARAPFFTGAVVPVLVGISVAWYAAHAIDWPLAGLTDAGYYSFIEMCAKRLAQSHRGSGLPFPQRCGCNGSHIDISTRRCIL